MNMSYSFFEEILSTLHKRVIFDAVSNYAGNSFFSKSWEVIEENNPFNVDSSKHGSSSAMSGIVGLIPQNVQVVTSKGPSKNDMSSSWAKRIKE